MRTTHKYNPSRIRLLLALGAILIMAGLGYAIWPGGTVEAVRKTAQSAPADSPIRVQVGKKENPIINAFDYRRAASMAMTGIMFDASTVTLTVNPPSGANVAPGSIISYALRVSNPAGDGDDDNVVVTMTVPTGTSFVNFIQNSDLGLLGGTPSCVGPNASGVITCSGGNFDLDDGEFANFILVVAVNNPTSATQVNFSSTYDSDDFGTGNVERTATHSIVAPTGGGQDPLAADLVLNKTASKSSVLAGGTSDPDLTDPEGTGDITFEIFVSNAGPANAVNVAMEDFVPANTILVGNPQLIASSVQINGVAQPSFSMPCNVFPAEGNLIQCLPGVNTAIDQAYTSRVLPALFTGLIRFRVRVPAGAKPGNLVTNEARLVSRAFFNSQATTPDPNAANNYQVPTQTLINAVADLGITKVTTNDEPVNGGAAYAYTVTVTNNGPSDAQNVVMNDPLPQGILFQNVSVVNAGGAQFICAGPAVGTNGVVSCTSGVLPPGGSGTISIVVQAAPNQASGVRFNTATVTSDTTEANPNTAPNSASVQVTLQVNAPLSITKTGPAIVNAGDTFTYQISVNNGGPSTAINATISDPLPANTTFLSMTGTGPFFGGCNHNGGTPGTVTCPTIDIPPGLHTLNITVKLSPNAPTGDLSNTATITTAGTGTIAVGTSTATATVRHAIDLEITKTASPNPVSAGENMTYTITVKNNGPSAAAAGEFRVLDPTFPPDGTTLVGTILAPGFNCNGGTAFPCGSSPALAVGATATIQFTVKVDPGRIDPIVNEARVETIGANVFDPVTVNNRSTVTTQVQPKADLAITKTAETFLGVSVLSDVVAGGTYFPGIPVVPFGTGTILYKLNYKNNGPGTAINVRIRDQVPANSKIIPWPPLDFSHATFTASGPIFTCSLLTLARFEQIECRPEGNVPLPPGSEGTIFFTVQVPADVPHGTVISNQATINSEGSQGPITPNQDPPATPDPSGGNNTSIETQNRVVAVADVGIAKTDSVDPVIAGTEFDYTITVRNAGPSYARDVVVTDNLPEEMTFSQIVSKPAEYACNTPPTGQTGTITCTRAALPPTGANPDQIVIRARMKVDTPSKTNPNCPVNRASVGTSTRQSQSFPPDLPQYADVLPNSVTESTCVIAVSDIAVNKTYKVLRVNPLVANSVVAGTEFEYTITVTNNGPSAAQLIRVIDDLPSFQRILDVQIQQSPDIYGMPNFKCAPDMYPIQGGAGAAELVCDAFELPPNKRPDGKVNPAGTVTFKLRVLQQNDSPQDNLPAQPEVDPYRNTVTVLSTSVDPVVSGNACEFPLGQNGFVDTTPDADGRFDNARFCVDVPVSYLADVTGTKTDDPDPVIAGKELTYTITGNNLGPSAALNYKITDQLPAGTVFISAVASAGASVSTPVVGANGTVTATWNAAGGTDSSANDPVNDGLTLPGVTRTLTIVVRICADFEQNFLGQGKTICQPNLTNEAVFSSDTKQEAGWTANDKATSVTTVQTQADLWISKSGPSEAPYSTSNFTSYVTYTINVRNDGPSNAVNTVVTDVLPKGFVVAPNGLTSNISGTTFEVIENAGVQTVKAKLGVLGADNQCGANPRPKTGTITIKAIVPIKHPVIAVTNTASIASDNCLADPDPADNTSTWVVKITMPGLSAVASYPATAEVSDQQPGSILFYPIYTSDAANPQVQDTRITMTNLSNTENVCVHLFAVDGTSCSVLDAFICLTPNQTTSLLASDFDPSNTGYIVAVAVDCETGLPINFNCLVGESQVKFSSKHRANLAAEGVQALMPYPAGADPNANTVDLNFDGMSYNRMPRVLALDSIPSLDNGNNTLLILNRVGGDFTVSASSIGSITGLLYDDAESPYSFTASFGCQARVSLSNSFPRTFTPFSRVIPSGRTGWMKLYGAGSGASGDKAFLGAMINYNANNTADAYSQGHNLHHLTLTSSAKITVPIVLPNCNF